MQGEGGRRTKDAEEGWKDDGERQRTMKDGEGQQKTGRPNKDTVCRRKIDETSGLCTRSQKDGGSRWTEEPGEGQRRPENIVKGWRRIEKARGFIRPEEAGESERRLEKDREGQRIYKAGGGCKSLSRPEKGRGDWRMDQTIGHWMRP